MALKIACVNGHTFTKETTLYRIRTDRRGEKERYCGICHAERCKKRRAKIKAEGIRRPGRSYHPEYELWGGLKQRCNNPKHRSYKEYGGSGISYDQSWNSFDAFLRDMGPRPSKNHSVDRIDNKVGYSKLNCRWATKREQVENRRIKYECYRGHPWTDKSILWVKTGDKKSRRCKICMNKKD